MSRSSSLSAPLLDLGPRAALRAGRLPRRLVQLVVGLWLFGFSMAMMIRAAIGLNPWDVLHEGVTQHLPLSFGTVVVVVGALVLLAWIPLRQAPGVGTVGNIVILGISVDIGLAVLNTPESLPARVALLIAGVLVNGFGSALYIGAQLGPGPRDGLMTGLAARTGRSIRLVRTSIEVAVLAVGFLLGGTAGVGTVVFALAIGPLVQFFLRYTVVDLRPRDAGVADDR